MIVNELKEKLPEGWKSKFVHRDLWDPDGYGVASFNLGGEREKVLAMNLKTEDIMEYFFDDLPDDEWISLDRSLAILKIKEPFCRKINKRYVIKDEGGKWNIKPMSKRTHYRSGYPKVSFSGKPIVSHRLVAITFIPNPFPESYNIVNHKNKDKTDFSKENLEWCDLEWNNKGENQNPVNSAARYIRLSDMKIFSSSELDDEYGLELVRRKIARSIREGKTFGGSYWETSNVNLENYLLKHPLTGKVYSHPTMSGIKADECGVLFINGVPKVGCFVPDSRYYVIRINGILYRSYRILAECYFNTVLSKDQIIDHIIPISDEDIDNSKENLKICTVAENNRNERSISKRVKAVRIYDLFGNLLLETTSRSEASRFLGYEKSHLGGLSLVANRNYLVIKESEELNSKIDYIFYKYEVIDGKTTILLASDHWSEIYEKSLPSASLDRIKKKYLNTGMPAPDGYYYQQGDPKNLLYIPDNTSYLKVRPAKKYWVGIKQKRQNSKDKNNNEEGN